MSTKREKYNVRPPSEVMTLERIGAFRLTSLSFLRTMLRNMMREHWQIEQTVFKLDNQGYGHAIYQIETSKHTFSFVVVSSKIKEEERSDRVISEKWDVTFALSEGIVSEDKIYRLTNELPKQEAGRGDAFDLVWSRANKSNRMFNYVIDSLVNGKQPDPTYLNEVGYLLRTTAVYGNGKFGLAPYEKIKNNHPFSGPFQAQMFAVYMLRHFSFDLVEHIAKSQNVNAAKLHPDIKRYIGTGNATGLGMAPYLISHPRIIHQWIYIREKAIAKVKSIQPTKDDLNLAIMWIDRIADYFDQSNLIDRDYFVDPETLGNQTRKVKDWVLEYSNNQTLNKKRSINFWHDLSKLTSTFISIEIEELLYTIMLEIYADHVMNLQSDMNVEETYQIEPRMTIKYLRELIKDQYSWTFQYDFNEPEEKYYFWYRSEEKEEPRLGVRGKDIGEELAMPLNIAEQVQDLYTALEEAYAGERVASFILRLPNYKGIIQRIQSLEGYEYGEIQANLLNKDLQPLYLLRCKLSFFGAERFNPKSDKWVRITLFQGAPLVEEIGQTFSDDWVFPRFPEMEGVN